MQNSHCLICLVYVLKKNKCHCPSSLCYAHCVPRLVCTTALLCNDPTNGDRYSSSPWLQVLPFHKREKKCKGTFRIFNFGLFCFISLFAITVTIYRLSYDNILQAICGSNLAQNINCHLSEKISLFVWDNFFFFPFSLARPPVESVLNFKDMFSHTVLRNNCGLET